MNRAAWQKAAIVGALLVSIGALLQMKQRTVRPPRGASPPQAVQRVAAPRLPRLVDLGSTTCVPCKLMAPVLDDLRKAYAGKLQVEFIDVRTDTDAATRYAIDAIPTQIAYDASGKEVFRHTGFFAREDLVAALKAHGIAR